MADHTMIKKQLSLAKDSLRRLTPTCAFCGKPAEGNHSVERDGFCLGPEVRLCDACGSGVEPTLTEIWGRIGLADVCLQCSEEIRHSDERRGSFHSWCYEEHP